MLSVNEGHNYLRARHQQAIVRGAAGRDTFIMDGMRNFWKRSDRSEKVPLLVLCLCVAVLIGLLLFRPL